MKNMKQLLSKQAYFLIGLSLLGFNSFASTYTVLNTNDSGAGSFRQAVSDANGHSGLDTVVFNAATNGLDINVTSAVIDVSDSLLIRGNGITNTFLVHQSAGFNCIQVNANFLLRVEECKMISATAGSGFLLVNGTNATIEVENCFFFGNNLNAIAINNNTNDSQVKVNRCRFESLGNSALMANGTNYMEVTNSFFNGGGFGINFAANSTGLVTSNTMVNMFQGGIQLGSAGSVLVRNNTITTCSIGLLCSGENITLENNILYGNTVDVEYAMFPPNNFTHVNNIVGTCLQNGMDACPLWYSNANPMLDPAGIQDNGGGTFTIALLAGSPAINNANASAPLSDQRGYSRPDAADIGAYEFNGIPPCDPNNLGSFTSQPSDLSICQHESILFNYGFTGLADSIQWNLSFDGINWFVDDPNVGDSLMVDSVDVSANGIYVMAIAYGCGAAFDSTIVVQLTVDTLNVGTTVNGITIAAVQPNATYQWLDCNNGYTQISGATSQNFTPSTNGNYAVLITNGACVDTSECVTISTIGLSEATLFDEVVIYPNPTTDVVYIHTGEQNNLSFCLRDVTGKIVFEVDKLNASENAIALKQPNGIYFLELKQGSLCKSYKLLINQ